MLRRLRRRLDDALADVASGVAHGLETRADIAVTGLRGAGKTVFLTALMHHLVRAAEGGPGFAGLAAARDRRLVAVAERRDRLQATPAFPSRRNREALLADPPSWPPSTVGVHRTELVIRHRTPGWLSQARNLLLEQSFDGLLTLGLVDYPGEWLLDLPLLDRSFQDWSADTLALLRTEPRRGPAGPFLAFLDGFDAGRPYDEEVLDAGHRLYRDLLGELKHRHDLTFVQPGRYVVPGPEGDVPLYRFFPAVVDRQPRRGSAGATLAERYRAYADRLVGPFFRDAFSRTNRQVVLVDLLSALAEGRAVYDDARRALEAIGEAVGVRRHGLLSGLLPRRFDRILFCATKADHAPAVQRERLQAHLAGIFGDLTGEAGVLGTRCEALAVAAVRCTEDASVTRDGETVDAVVGKPVGGAFRQYFHPGHIPIERPGQAFWQRPTLKLPDFAPPPPSAEGDLPHIRMDMALEFLIGDLLG